MLDDKPFLLTNWTCIFGIECKKMLDEKKFGLVQISSSTIQHDFFFFYEILDEISALKRIQHFVQYCKFCMLNEMMGTLKSAFNESINYL